TTGAHAPDAPLVGRILIKSVQGLFSGCDTIDAGPFLFSQHTPLYPISACTLHRLPLRKCRGRGSAVAVQPFRCQAILVAGGRNIQAVADRSAVRPVPSVDVDDVRGRRCIRQIDVFRLRSTVLRKPELIAVRFQQLDVIIAGKVAQGEREVRGLVRGETEVILVRGGRDQGVERDGQLHEGGVGDASVRFVLIGTGNGYGEASGG